MGIAARVVAALASAGHEAVHLRDEGLQALPDEAVLAKALAEKRILLAHDLDMARLIALSGEKAPSLVTFRLSNMRPEAVLPRLMDVISVFGADLESGAAVTVDDRSSRCHRLPLEG
jgi:predicted nuclease of predicted toxin-antitoxin system